MKPLYITFSNAGKTVKGIPVFPFPGTGAKRMFLISRRGISSLNSLQNVHTAFMGSSGSADRINLYKEPGRVPERKRIMKKVLSFAVCLCLLGCAAASAEEIKPDSFLLRIWDESGLEISYLRFDMYLGENDYIGLVCSTPDEGEDFYRFPYEVEDPESLKNMRIECSYGVSDLPPEDAILQVMMGNASEEHPLLTLDFIPECGRIYDLSLVSDGDGGWMLVPAEPAQG